MKCQDCGTTDGVRTVNDPYDEDVNGVETEMDLCRKCEQERANDI